MVEFLAVLAFAMLCIVVAVYLWITIYVARVIYRIAREAKRWAMAFASMDVNRRMR